MHTFQDKTGQDWTIDLDLSLIKRVEAYDFGPALGDISESGTTYLQFFPPPEDFFTNILANPKVCFGIIWCCVQDQAQGRNISDENEFARLFNGKAIADSRIALYEELPDFFPEMATTLRNLINRFSKLRQVTDRKLAAHAMDSLSDEKIEEMVDSEINRMIEAADKRDAKTEGT